MNTHIVGQDLVRRFVNWAGLTPDEKILEVGCSDKSCGWGRIAAALTEYVSSKGEYHGFDIVAEGIVWCRQHISSRFSNFHFKHADIFNAVYNPAGKTLPANFEFPYPDGTFDFVCLTSIFTHMLQPELEHYLDEIFRVLKPGGRCFITYFLLNPESRRMMELPGAIYNFQEVISQHCHVLIRDRPEEAVAYDQAWLEQIYSKHGLQIAEPVRQGFWCGRPKLETNMGQDVVIARKPGA